MSLQLTNRAPTTSRPLPITVDRSHLIVFVVLLFLELISFGPILRQGGVYLDEWIFFQNLHFAGPSFLNSFLCLVNDPRVIVRPIEALHYGLLYTLAHEKPFLYHFVNQLYEVAAAWFLYRVVTTVTTNKRMAFITAALFLLYPNHDSTHYSIGASTISVSLAFFTFSCWQFAAGLKRHSHAQIAYAAVAYLISVFDYELSLPLVLAYPLIAISLRLNHSVRTRRRLLAAQLPMFVSAAAIIVYRSKILPALHLGFGYRVSFDFARFISVLLTGFKTSLAPDSFLTFGQMALTEFRGRDVLFELIILIPVVTITTITLRLLHLSDQRIRLAKHKATADVELFSYTPLVTIVMGIILIFASYAIYGCSPDYLPTLTTCINRINAGAAIGSALVIAGFVETIVEGFATSILAAPLVSFLIILFTLTNWHFSTPWFTSWQAQKQIQSIIMHNAKSFTASNAVILANVPRYVDWAPVYDGVWDFQSTCRILLNDKNVSAGVLSPRMVVTKDSVIDKAGNLVCATYPIKGMLILVPSPETWISIDSPKKFIDVARKFDVEVIDETQN